MTMCLLVNMGDKALLTHHLKILCRTDLAKRLQGFLHLKKNSFFICFHFKFRFFSPPPNQGKLT